ncbi:hypothetical protein Goarm_012998 [Gossypium armourianum]|uniref:Uncharacterized protein n=1 Tax=Gossypium armourianum TaxID=34283 RepID=A0A7J9J1K9_9ROSI|nr:hypothetical protein [Gossypium armourianum]
MSEDTQSREGDYQITSFDSSMPHSHIRDAMGSLAMIDIRHCSRLPYMG